MITGVSAQMTKPIKVQEGKSFLVRAIAAGQRSVERAVQKRKRAEEKALSASTLRF